MQFSRFLRLFVHTQLMPVLESGEETLVGGQAVMEGVMMRAPHSYCVAVRKANGEVVTEHSELPKVSEKYPIFKLPVLRGLATLGQEPATGSPEDFARYIAADFKRSLATRLSAYAARTFSR